MAEATRRLRLTDVVTLVLFVALITFLVFVARSQPAVAADAGALPPAPTVPAGANSVDTATAVATAPPATRTAAATPTPLPTATPAVATATPTTTATPTASPSATAAPPTATAPASPTALPASPTATNTPAPATPTQPNQSHVAPAPPPAAPGQVQGVGLATGYVGRGATQTVVGVASPGTLLSVTVTFANGQYVIARGYTDYQGVYRAAITVPYGVPAGNAHVVVAGPLDSRWTNFTVG